MLSILTVNIGAASRERAEALLKWLADRPEDLFVLTETSSGDGTAYLFKQFARAGFAITHLPDADGDRGVGLISRVPFTATAVALFPDISIPARLSTATLDTQPKITIVGVYVPSRDRSQAKTEKKERFLTTLVDAVTALHPAQREHLIIGGDYNVIARTHQPLHAGFLPFEFKFLEELTSHGFVDAYEECAPNTQAYSWIGRTGDGYRYDYFHVGRAIAPTIAACTYLHETRELNLTDHAAMTLRLDMIVPEHLKTTDVGKGDPLALF